MRSKRKRKNRRSRSFNKNILVSIILIFLGLFFYSLIRSNIAKNFVFSKNSDQKIAPASSFGNIPLSPYPTPTPTPTPIPLVGYCLNVPVLMYHHIQPEAQAESLGQKALTVDNGTFDLQMQYLTSHGYSTISAETLVNALISRSGLPSKSVVITIDDGYSDIYSYAYPIFQKYHMTANLMIPTGLLGGADYLTWGQLEEMARSGLVYVTDHTWSHYAITRGPMDKIKFEIETAKNQLQDHAGQNINLFTYPYGAFDVNAISVLRQDGFIGAFSEIPGTWQCDSFVMTLHRTRIGNASMSYYGF